MKELASEHNTDYVSSLERLLLVPDLRWERTRGGTVGKHIDISLENRLLWLVQLVERSRSSFLMKVMTKLYEHFVDGWNTRRVSVDPVELIKVLEQLDQSPWLAKNGGNKIHAHILEVVLSDMSCARTWEWGRSTCVRKGPCKVD